MPRKIYLILLIFCEIWLQGINGTFADENIKNSSFLARQKRVISLFPGEDRMSHIEDYPYIVNIRKYHRIFCVGTILSHRIVITAAECAQLDKRAYEVRSNSGYTNRGTDHNVTEIKVYHGNHPGRTSDGIALLTVNPVIVYDRHSNKIDLHVGPLLPGILGTVCGWGYNSQSGEASGTEIPLKLRAIRVPIMAHQDCVHRYRFYYPISDKDICTFDPRRRSGHTDAGAPLVINNLLVGIFLRRGPIQTPFETGYPDVFALLQHIDYGRWIRANI